MVIQLLTHQTDQASTTAPTWSSCLAEPAQEFPLSPLPILSGQVPVGLRGSLYRNGPARLERGGKKAGHWFDGDGAILGVHFTDDGVRGVYRYVQTAGYQAESQADRFLYANYNTYPEGGLWSRLTATLKNAANTSAIAVQDKLLALWEAGSPYSLDLETLETLGIDDLGTHNPRFICSAHPKRDPITGDLYNFGVDVATFRPKLTLYRSDATGTVQQQNSVPLDGLTVLHDFLLAGPYLVFFVPPLRVHLPSLLFRWTTFSNSLQWLPHLGTQILVFDRQSLQLVSRSTAEPWFHWHVGNGCVDADGQIVLDLARLQDGWRINQRLQEMVSGTLQTAAPATLHRMVLDPETATIRQFEELSTLPCEFPVVDPACVGQPWRYTFMNVQKPLPDRSDLTNDWFNSIARFDHDTGDLVVADLGTGRYPVEPIYAPDAIAPEQGWVLTVVYDGNRETSEVWIFHSDRIDDEPVCRLGLPGVIPLSFHGSWNPARSSRGVAIAPD